MDDEFFEKLDPVERAMAIEGLLRTYSRISPEVRARLWRDLRLDNWDEDDGVLGVPVRNGPDAPPNRLGGAASAAVPAPPAE